MNAKKIASVVAAAMLLNATVAVAETPSSGVTSNRTALSIVSGQDSGGTPACAPGTADCAATVGNAGAQAGKAKLLYVLAGLAATGGIIAIATTSGHKRSPVSP